MFTVCYHVYCRYVTLHDLEVTLASLGMTCVDAVSAVMRRAPGGKIDFEQFSSGVFEELAGQTRVRTE